MENGFLPFAPVDFRGEPEPVPRTQVLLGYVACADGYYLGLVGTLLKQAVQTPPKLQKSMFDLRATYGDFAGAPFIKPHSLVELRKVTPKYVNS